MNRRGTLFVVNLMIAVMAFFAVIAMIPGLKEGVTTARTDLDCDNTSISAETEMTCIQVGGFLPIFIGTALAVAIGYLVNKQVNETT